MFSEDLTEANQCHQQYNEGSENTITWQKFHVKQFFLIEHNIDYKAIKIYLETNYNSSATKFGDMVHLSYTVLDTLSTLAYLDLQSRLL